jgi:menaquinone-dependent protoporphyrinogen IX oxidase
MNKHGGSTEMSKKALVVYYSWSNGNTQKIAELVQKAMGADIARVETVVPYSGSYDDVATAWSPARSNWTSGWLI